MTTRAAPAQQGCLRRVWDWEGCGEGSLYGWARRVGWHDAAGREASALRLQGTRLAHAWAHFVNAWTHLLHAPPPTPQVYLSGSVSSQYLTALLMAAPLATGSEGIEIIIKDELVSQPYVDMTVKLMARFGVEVQQLDGLRHMRIPPGQT